MNLQEFLDKNNVTNPADIKLVTAAFELKSSGDMDEFRRQWSVSGMPKVRQDLVNAAISEMFC